MIIGKIMRWLSDLKASAFRDVANNLTTTEDGYVLDARQGKTLQEAIDNISTSFVNGCRTIARAITAGRGTYSSPVDGVSTADNASPDIMATNINTLATTNYNAGVSVTKVGTAVAADVLTGKTFTSSSGVGIEGGMMDYTGTSRQSVAPTGGTGNETLTLNTGKHDSVVVNRTAPYNSGYTAGQNSIKNGTAVTLSVGSYDVTNKRYTVTTNTNAYVGGTAKTLTVSATDAYNAGKGDATLHKVAVGTMSSTSNGKDTYDFTFSVPGVELTADNFFVVITQVGGSGRGTWGGWNYIYPTVTYNASTGAVRVTGMSGYSSEDESYAIARVNSATLYCVYTKPARSFITTK